MPALLIAVWWIVCLSDCNKVTFAWCKLHLHNNCYATEKFYIRHHTWILFRSIDLSILKWKIGKKYWWLFKYIPRIIGLERDTSTISQTLQFYGTFYSKLSDFETDVLSIVKNKIWSFKNNSCWLPPYSITNAIC